MEYAGGVMDIAFMKTVFYFQTAPDTGLDA